ncbi:A/G-specific adenine glycosylase [Gimesia sp.]|uniref:A/G-specific adenine glycosylase n=1 Tax=Gimesia sp. TaxID=2024833 RepID=UPI000C4C10E6|nr:A/G-specific adenine glycosylase [Gimesia sp.]MAX38701.1 A/G-specific adenine glycosylase [Gimesia sp.]HBL44051.1 A/G-specific adenine glycosylase [Planctomycetaceae bacterium]|tara:strand:- start:49148 stop:50374 length:1227 start_codon:yes stop_codon:yes gene_type:complete
MSELSEIFDAGRRQKFRRQLQSWYASHQRDLPWRRERDPYAVWISEIMLQQTVVAAVIPYFKRFMARFPDVQTLAAADESEVLQHWEGLGYYSRARNIHKTAKLIAGELQGNFPRDVESLQKLPGIGRYTAGAICSFAYDVRAPIVEANTLRLYSRLIGLEEDPRSKSGQNQLWEFAELILPRKSPGDFNQALMDLGSLVCTPQNPGCEACPVSSGCEAFLRQKQHLIPVPKGRPEITSLTDVSIAVFSGNQVMIRQRLPGERWAGLWDFPRLTLEEMNGSPHPAAIRKKTERQQELFPAERSAGLEIPEGLSPALIPRLETYLKEQADIEASLQQLVTEIRHSVTRYKIRLLCFVAQLEQRAAKKKKNQLNSEAGKSGYQWVSVQELEAYPLSVTGRKFAKLLAERM